MANDTVSRDAKALAEAVTEIRRDLHRHPELGFREFRTAKMVSEFLAARGIEHRAGVATTGVLATIRGAAPGRTVALRADMDDLPLEEKNQAPYASATAGVMHACGHDGHVAILLGAADILQRRRGEFSGAVRLVFQPAEEGLGGAIPLLDAGAMEDPRADAVFALHIWNATPVGRISLSPGAVMAAADEFAIRVIGRGGHGSQPQETVDPVLAAAQIVTSLQSIVSRSLDPLDPAVLTVATIHGGTAHNIIPAEVEMTGTLRSFRQDAREALIGRLREVAENTARAMGAHAEVTVGFGYPVTENDPGMTAFARTVASRVLGEENVLPARPVMGAEDFSHYRRRAPGCMIFLGSSNVASGLVHPHHSALFDFDEACLPIGVELMTRLALDYLAAPA
jgi:amidohydrolase